MAAELVCPHNPAYKPANCVDCMNEGRIAAVVKTRAKAEKWISARHDGICAECDMRVREGDDIGLIEGVGWCCTSCAE